MFLKMKSKRFVLASSVKFEHSIEKKTLKKQVDTGVSIIVIKAAATDSGDRA